MTSHNHTHISIYILLIYFFSIVVGEALPLLSSADDATVKVEKSCKANDMTSEDGAKSKVLLKAQSDYSPQGMTAEIPCAPVNHQLENQFGIYLDCFQVDYIEASLFINYPYINVIENPPSA